MFELRPFKKAEDVVERMLKSVNEMFDSDYLPTLSEKFNFFKTDVHETETAYVVEADLPGFEKEDINIDITDNYLTIRAKRDVKKEARDKEDRVIRQERQYGEFMRRFYVDNIDEDGIKAQLENGVLNIEIPKQKPEKPSQKTIEIE